MKKYIFAIALIASVLFVSSLFAAAVDRKLDVRGMSVPTNTVLEWGKWSKIATPSDKNINDTPSIKEMQSKKAPDLALKADILGNRVPTQTDNSGKIKLGQ